MKVTFDSSEPLADAIRVIGALYNVTLTHLDALDDAQQPGVPVSPSATRSNGKPAASKRKQSQRPPALKPVRAQATLTRRSAAKAADPGEIRAWAKANGHAVNDRGPLSGTVRAAYAATITPKLDLGA
ncbi:MAG: Lsr2 family DNA-binding protein [Dermatophilaceae bacterium]